LHIFFTFFVRGGHKENETRKNLRQLPGKKGAQTIDLSELQKKSRKKALNVQMRAAENKISKKKSKRKACHLKIV